MAEKNVPGAEIEERERRLRERLERVAELEKEITAREKAVRAREGTKKQLLLRLSPSLWDDIAAWAEEDFRSINGQIEYLLADAVKRRGR